VPERAFAICSLLFVMLVWGSAFAVTKVALAEVPPLLLALLRFAIASVLLATLIRVRGSWAPLRSLPLGRLTSLGLTGVSVYFLCFNFGLVYTTATDGALIQGAIPAVTAGLAAVVLGEDLTRARALGIGVSILGVVLLVLAGGRGGDAADPLLGNLLMVASVLSWSAYTVLGKGMQHLPRLPVTAATMLIGTVLLTPAAAYDLVVRPPAAVSSGGWLAVAYLGAGATALGYLVWDRALRSLDAGQVAGVLNLIPVIGVASAALLLGETPYPAQLGGGALVLAGVWLSTGTAAERTPRARGQRPC
jgi:drug/metabolite transporter (DMT)-like permease